MLLALLASCGQGGAAIDPALSSALDAAGPGGRVPVIVRYAGGATPRLIPPGAPDRAALRARALREAMQQNLSVHERVRPLLEARGIADASRLWIVNGASFAADAGAIRALAQHPDVASISLDRPLRLAAPSRAAATPTAPAWNLGAIHAPEAWAAGHTGRGAVVAVLDTGVDAKHPDLAPRWRGGPGDWFDAFGTRPAPGDPQGHGTQVAGLIVGGDASGSAIGVAPGARWIAAKIFDDAGASSSSAIHRAFQWALDPDGDPSTDDAPDVVNNSWGMRENVGECITDFDDDLAALRAAGIAVVFSAGDGGPAASSSMSPANAAGALSVGSVDSLLAIEHDSSRGPSACGGGLFPALSAPGSGVRTSDLTYGGAFPGSYATVSGTSFAAPHLSGVLAIVRAAAPSATMEQIEQALAATAIDLGVAGPDNDFGGGLLDVAAALRLLAVPDEDAGVDAGTADAGDDAGGGNDDAGGVDGGVVDAGAPLDAGTASDAESAPDAGAGSDAGHPAPDASDSQLNPTQGAGNAAGSGGCTTITVDAAPGGATWTMLACAALMFMLRRWPTDRSARRLP